MSILFSKFLFKLFNFIENNENCDMLKNGEANFIKFILKNYDNKFIFFDVGANKGDYSNIILELNNSNKNLSGNLFEPVPKCYEILNKKFKSDYFVVNNLACSNISKKINFYFNSKDSHSSLFDWEKNSKKITVNCIKLVDYIKYNKINKINLLKIDAEGNDLFVLKGLEKKLDNKLIDFIQFEYGIPNIYSKTYLKDFYDLLENNGFIIGKLMPNNIEIRKYSHYMENFHNSNYVAVSKEFINKNTWIKYYLKGEIN